MTEPSKETVNKQWYDEKQARLKKDLERLNIPESKKYLLESAEVVCVAVVSTTSRGLPAVNTILLLCAHARRMRKTQRLQADRKRKRKLNADDNAGMVGVTLRTTALAADKRSARVPVDLEAYERQKREQPEFYRAGDSLLYGGKGEVAPEAVDRMVAELNAKYVVVYVAGNLSVA